MSFHEGLREAMGDARTPQEIAILNDQRIAERRVVDERDGYKLHLTVTAGPEIKMIAEMGRDLEENDDVPDLHWHRDGNGSIDGIILTGKLSRGTLSRVPELRYEEVTR